MEKPEKFYSLILIRKIFIHSLIHSFIHPFIEKPKQKPQLTLKSQDIDSSKMQDITLTVEIRFSGDNIVTISSTLECLNV